MALSVRPTSRNNSGSTKVSGGWRNVLFGGRRVPAVNNTFWKYNARYSLDHHTGVDFGMRSGTPVNLPIGGKVVTAGWGGPYGNTVVVQMSNGDYMRFAHLSKIGVSRGQRLKAGAYVGAVGSTGTSTGAHLHLEVMKESSGGRFGKNSFLDPLKYLNGVKTGAISADPPKGSGGSSGGSSGGGNTTINTTTSSSGGFGNVAGFSKKDFYAAFEAMYGDLDVLFELDKQAKSFGGKSLKWAIDKMVKEKIVDADRAQTILNQTGWFKKYSTEISQRLVNEKSRPDMVKAEVAKIEASVKTRLAEFGVQLGGDSLRKISRNAFIFGWSEEQIVDQIQASGAKFSGGAIAAAEDDVRQYADDFGVTLTEADIRQLRNNILDAGPEYGKQATAELIQQRSAQTYGIWADRILAGESVRTLGAAYFAKAAELLEVDANEVSWDDPLFAGGKAFTAVDPKTGQQIQKGLWDFEKEIRQDARWMTTKNARDSMVETTGNLLNTMGLI